MKQHSDSSSTFSSLSTVFLAVVLFFAGLVPLTAPAAPRKSIQINYSPSKAQLIKRLLNWQEEVENFEDKNDQETTLKLDWIYRLRFLVERRYDGSEASLLRILRFMHDLEKPREEKPKEAKAPPPDDKPSLVKNLLEAIEKERERHEPLWLFVKTFVDNNSMSKPKTAKDFAEERDYINNFETFRAKTLTPDEIQSLLAKLGADETETEPAQKNPHGPEKSGDAILDNGNRTERNEKSEITSETNELNQP